MSKQNKVNPGRYTQRGRLTQDDAARAFARQRALGSQYTPHPAKKDQMLGPAAQHEATPGPETSDDVTVAKAKQPAETAKPAPRRTSAPRTKTAVREKHPAKVRTRTVKTTGAVRRAALARNAGGPALKPPRAAKRTKRALHTMQEK